LEAFEMGRVFTWQEIENDEIPTIEDFSKLKEELVRRLRGSRAILGAQLCGSVPRGDFNIGSDLDVVAVYRHRQEDQAIKLLQELDAFAFALHIPLELIPIDDLLAGTSDHTFTPSFLEHLRGSERFDGSIIKTPPATVIVPSQYTLLEDTRQYLQHKLRKFQKSYIKYQHADDVSRARLLEKVLAFPTYAGRKLLRTLGHTFPNGDGKDEVRMQCKKQLRFVYEIISITQILSADHRKFAESKRRDKKEYEFLIEQTEQFIPVVIGLALGCLALLRKVE
jgi:predicted nucleotidyltransferase